MRPTRDQWAMELVNVTARRSTCCRRNVGCVLLNALGHVIATGVNGVARGMPHCNHEEVRMVDSEPPYVVSDSVEKIFYPNACEGAFSKSGTNLDGCQAIHAECNAMLQCRNVQEIHTAYVSASPCISCVKLLMNTSCRRVVFAEEYPHPQSRKLWEAAGREWVRFTG